MTPEPKPSRVTDAYDRLKAEILQNRLPPGFQATEPEIAARLGMSRTPVREALIRLEGEGLVRLVPRRGALVLPISPADMAEIYQILAALEPEAAASLAAQRPAASALAPLEKATATMESALADGDLERWVMADDRFHRTVLALQDNRRLEGVLTTLFDQAQRVRMVTLRLRQPPVSSTREHRAIVAAIAAGDVSEAHRLSRAHRQRAAGELLDLLEKVRLHNL